MTEANEVTLSIPAMADGGTVLLTVNEGSITDIVEETENSQQTIPPNTLRIHYQREDNTYDNLGIWAWDDAKPSKIGQQTACHLKKKMRMVPM